MIRHLAGMSLCSARRRRARARVLASAVATPAEKASRDSQSQSATCPMNAACAEASAPELDGEHDRRCQGGQLEREQHGSPHGSLGSRPRRANKPTWRANARVGARSRADCAGMSLSIGAIAPLLQVTRRGRASSARLSSSTFTRGSPRKPSQRSSVWAATSVAHLRLGQVAGGGDAGDLELGRGRADVRVEPAARRGDQVDGHRALAAQLLDAGLDPVDQGGAGRAEVGAAGGRGVVAVGAGGRGARVEVGRAGEVLADQRRADDGAVADQQAAAGLVGEEQAGEAGDGQRIGEAGEHGQAEEHDQGGAELGQHGWFPQARPTAVTARSISLMPTNGTTIPPRP